MIYGTLSVPKISFLFISGYFGMLFYSLSFIFISCPCVSRSSLTCLLLSDSGQQKINTAFPTTGGHKALLPLGTTRPSAHLECGV